MSDGNKNIVEVETIENLIMLIISHLEQITAKTPNECKAVWDAFEYIKLFQSNQAMDLRTAFE